MKKYPIYIMLIAIVMLNITNLAHGACTLGDVFHEHAVDSELTSDLQDHDQNNYCDCCHGPCPHTVTIITTNKVAYHLEHHALFFSRDDSNYPSHHRHPPSRPPRA